MHRQIFSEIKTIKRWVKNNKIFDVILFGSFVRGKSLPNDIDLCILIKDSDEKKTLDLVDSLAQVLKYSKFKFQINILTSSDFTRGNSLAKTLLNEGFSVKKGKKFAEIFGFKNQSLFTYSLKNFNDSERVKLHYLLNGRSGARGILKEIKGCLIGKGAIIVPTENEDFLKEVFDKWKVNYKAERILFC